MKTKVKEPLKKKSYYHIHHFHFRNESKNYFLNPAGWLIDHQNDNDQNSSLATSDSSPNAPPNSGPPLPLIADSNSTLISRTLFHPNQNSELLSSPVTEFRSDLDYSPNSNDENSEDQIILKFDIDGDITINESSPLGISDLSEFSDFEKLEL